MIEIFWVDAFGLNMEVSDDNEVGQAREIWEQLYAEKLGIA